MGSSGWVTPDTVRAGDMVFVPGGHGLRWDEQGPEYRSAHVAAGDAYVSPIFGYAFLANGGAELATTPHYAPVFVVRAGE